MRERKGRREGERKREGGGEEREGGRNRGRERGREVCSNQILVRFEEPQPPTCKYMHRKGKGREQKRRKMTTKIHIKRQYVSDNDSFRQKDGLITGI